MSQQAEVSSLTSHYWEWHFNQLLTYLSVLSLSSHSFILSLRVLFLLFCKSLLRKHLLPNTGDTEKIISHPWPVPLSMTQCGGCCEVWGEFPSENEMNPDCSRRRWEQDSLNIEDSWVKKVTQSWTYRVHGVGQKIKIHINFY